MSVARRRQLGWFGTRWWCKVAAVVLGALVLGGCRTDVTVSISQRLDGSGRVSVRAVLDRDAASKAGDLTKLIRLDDLRARGWQVVGPVPLPPGGRVEFRVEKAVTTPEQAQAVLADISGVKGPFAGLRITRDRSPVSVRSRVAGPIDLRAGYAAFGDAVLASRLSSASPLGVDPKEVERQFGAPLEQLVPVHLEVEVPGSKRVYDLTAGQTLQVDVSSRTWNLRLGLALLGLALAGAGWALVGRGVRRRV